MSEFNRRNFLRLLGQGTAALGMGFSLGSGVARAREESVTTGVSASTDTSGKYQIFYPGEYLDWEKEEIEKRFELANEEPEPRRPIANPFDSGVAEEHDLLAYNSKWDPFNPLFNDKEYARKAGYPDVPAWPDYKGFIAGGPDLKFHQYFTEVGYNAHGPDDRLFYTPIFPGDSFSLELEKPIFEDITVPGSNLRRWKIGVSGKMYNQKDELVVRGSTIYKNAYMKILDGSAPPVKSEMFVSPVYYTTDEEWEYIKELWKKEYIRGSQKLYWEDVKVGDEPAWVCSGAVSPMDMMAWYASFPQYAPWSVRNTLLKGGGLFRDRYGQYMIGEAGHIFNMNDPDNRMYFYNDTAAKIITRMVTNYIGDAGFVTRIGWDFKHFDELRLGRAGAEYFDQVPYMKGKGCTEHGGEGDTVIGKGYVTDKYINDKGEGIIDLVCWAETLDEDKIIEVCPAAARLPLKKG